MPSLDVDILNKIEKLLKLANGTPSVDEANAAMHKAHELLKDHNLSIDDINDKNKKRVYGIPAKSIENIDPPKWKLILLMSVAKANYTISMQTDDGYVLFGSDIDVLASNLMLEYLIETVEILASRFEEETTSNYTMGCVQAISSNLLALCVEDTKDVNSRELSLRKSQNVMDQLQKLFQDITEEALADIAKNDSAFYKGYKDGLKVSLNKQVE